MDPSRNTGQQVQDLACACIGKAAASRNIAALATLDRSLQPGERIEGVALCGLGIKSAGIAAVTDRRILFVSRGDSITDVPYGRVRAIHREWCAAPQRKVRVAIRGAKPLHMVSKLGLDVATVIQSHIDALT